MLFVRTLSGIPRRKPHLGMEVWQLTERFVAQHVAKALQGEQIICLEISWRTMPAILMTQSRRLLTNQGDVTTSCLRKSLGGGGEACGR